MSERARLLQSIANTIADYRAGEIPKPTPVHVERWISQFDQSAQQPILAESPGTRRPGEPGVEATA